MMALPTTFVLFFLLRSKVCLFRLWRFSLLYYPLQQRQNLMLATADKVTNKAYSDDADSVLYWVQEMQCEEFNPVLFFKPQGQKSDFNGVEEKDFLLALQTQFQKEMFEKHVQKLICVDSTHGTTAYDFQLVTVLVIDDYNEGIPVAWLISNKETTDALKIFFSSLRECCGEVQTETFER